MTANKLEGKPPMNTDKLMELERKWRGEASDLRSLFGNDERAVHVADAVEVCADELAAAHRAEQAVGEEQIARELLAEEMEPTYSTTAKRLRDPEFPTDGFPTATQAGIRAIRRALGTARQSEGVVVEATPMVPNSFGGMQCAWRMDGYYIGFNCTGIAAVDLILSAVACAGKAYHHTEDWNEDCDPYHERLRGTSPAEWIQNAANDAAALLAAAPGGEGEVGRG